MRKVDVFHNRCLRKICNIYWPNKIRNVELHKKTDSMNMSLEIKHFRLRWLSHVLRMSEDRIPKVAMRWTPSGRRKRGRPKTTWQRTVMKELVRTRWVFLGEKHRPKHGTGLYGEVLFRPYVPDGMKRMSE